MPEPIITPANPDPLAWRAILGVTQPRIPGWEQVRRAQVEELLRLRPVAVAIHFSNAVLLCAVIWDAVPIWQLLAWATAMTLTIASIATGPRPGTMDADIVVRRVIGYTLFLGLLWAVPSGVFAGTGTLEQQLSICLVSAAVVAGVTFVYAALPLTMLIFLATSVIGLSLMMAQTGSIALTVLPLAYGCCLALGGLSSGRAFISRKWAELALAEKREVMSLLLRESDKDSADWLWQVDAARRLVNVSAPLAQAARRTADALEGTPLFKLLAGDRWEDPRQAPELRALVERMNARQRLIDFELPVAMDGETRWWRLSAAPREDHEGNFAGYHGVGADITEARVSAAKIDRMARFDALTGLANRIHFSEALRKALNHAFRDRGRCALMLIDLDRFKPVNDTLGHPVGDKLLKLVAQRLSGLIRQADTCGRLGGDEFAIVVADAADQAAVDHLGVTIIAALSEPFEIDGNIVRIGASVGTAYGPRDGRSADMLVRNADLALYRAKEDGRGRHVVFESSLLVRAQKRKAIESALRGAMEGGQLHLLYQPVVTVADGSIAGFEALIRWRHPDLGEILPDDFLPIAAEARLISQIGEWVLRTACEEVVSWPQQTRLYVNLSRDQLCDPRLPAIVLSALAQSGLSANRLELEVGESAFGDNGQPIVQAIDRLRSLGIRIALDDFGASGSMLGHIHQGRFNTVKVDRCLIVGAVNRQRNALGLIRAIIALAETLGIDTTAEGTELAAEHALARQLGFSHFQGYLFGLPVPPEDARALLASSLRRTA